MLIHLVPLIRLRHMALYKSALIDWLIDWLISSSKTDKAMDFWLDMPVPRDNLDITPYIFLENCHISSKFSGNKC